MSTSPTSLDLTQTYVRLDADLSATSIEVDGQFWDDVMTGRRHDLDAGTVVAAFDYGADWTSSEAHPAGDELVIVLDGRIDLVLELDDGEQVVPLQAGRTAVVPAGVFHRAVVHEPGRAIHVTPGAGTTHRPVPVAAGGSTLAAGGRNS